MRHGLKIQLQMMSIIGVCMLSLCSCRGNVNTDSIAKGEGIVEDTELQTPETINEEEVIWDEKWYSELLTEISDEEIISIEVDDFDGDGKNEAYKILQQKIIWKSFLI